jgi:hypothetical protein
VGSEIAKPHEQIAPPPATFGLGLDNRYTPAFYISIFSLILSRSLWLSARHSIGMSSRGRDELLP